MRKVTGNGTIDQDCGFNLEYLTGTPTTATGTGDRWYTGEESGRPVIVHHTEGTPSNRCATTIYSPEEVRVKFSYDWDNVPSFSPVKAWVESNS